MLIWVLTSVQMRLLSGLRGWMCASNLVCEVRVRSNMLPGTRYSGTAELPKIMWEVTGLAPTPALWQCMLVGRLLVGRLQDLLLP